MSPVLVIALVLAGGLVTAFIVLLTSSSLFGFYIFESIRRILRLSSKRPK